MENKSHKYTVIPEKDGKYMAVMILSEHDQENDAYRAIIEAMNKESEEIMNRQIEELRERGIPAVSFKEAIKNMTPEERERFIEKRNRKFVIPLLNRNIEMLDEKMKQLKSKSEK